jgi:hypothetical protein
MEKHVNRAEQLYRNWEAQQKQLESLAGADSRVIQQQKYAYLRQGLYRLSLNPSEQEKLLIQVIRSVTDKLQRQLYPNPVIRLLHRIKAAVYDQPAHLRGFIRQREANLEQLKGQLKTMGFASFSGKLEKYLDYETAKVSIVMTSQLAEQCRLDISLNMERDKTGQYRFQHYEATLFKNGESRTYTFQADSGITAIEAANLLDGRAVKKTFETADGSMAQKWVQLDRQQKDKDGNPKLMEFHEAYGYHLKNELLANSVLLGTAGLAKDKVIQSLEQGNRVSFTLHQHGTYYLQANPAGREVSFYDKEMKPLTMPQLQEINRQQQIKPLHHEVSLLKTNEQPEEKQAMGIR